MIRLLSGTAADLGLRHRELLTVAGHDAVPMNGLCPTGLLFIPSVDGISHNESEFSTLERVVAGADVLLNATLSCAA